MAPKPSSSPAELFRLVSWHRRKLAVIAAMSAAAIGITALSPKPAPTTTVVVADHRLNGGLRLDTSDLRAREIPTAAVPADAVRELDQVVGQTLIAPLSAGSVLTELSVLGDRPVVEDDHILAPVRVADPAVVDLLRPGDRIDILASSPESGGQTRRIAEDVRVVTIPQPDSDSGGLTGGTVEQRTLLLVEVPREQATALADAAAGSQLGVVLR